MNAHKVAVFALGAALLAGSAAPVGAYAATASAPAAHTRSARALPPQQNVPTLQAGGAAQDVVYPPDNQYHNGPSQFTIIAPPHTAITAVKLNCYGGQSCPVSIASDGHVATGHFSASSWLFDRPLAVTVTASPNAPLAGGTFNGSFTLEGVTQPLTVVITPGVPGVVAGRLRNTNPAGNGVRVMSVDAGTKTAASGLQPGDVITGFDGNPTPTVNDLDAVLADKRGGATYPITVNRSGDIITLRLTLDPEDY